MVAGLKTGGRQKGTPNKATLARASAPEAIDPAFPKYRIARLDSLIPYVNNARTHTPAQVSKIAASIREFGFTNPVLVDGKRGIIAGHGRVLAAQMLAMDVVPVIELSHLSPAQRRAYVIADNRLALDAGWDDELLALELGELRDEGFNLELTGFDLGELKLIFADDDDGESGGGSGAGSLAVQFGIPPFSVLNAREGWWQDRKRAWLALGIQSELGRGENAIGRSDSELQKNGRDLSPPANATPGGAKLPAADYGKSRARGDVKAQLLRKRGYAEA